MIKKILFFSDTHFPYEDKKAWKIFVAAANYFKPNILVCLGDLIDFYSVSAHSKDPKRKSALSYELDYVKERLSELNKINCERKIFIEGNHEDRLRRYLWDVAPELYGIVDYRKELKFTENNWEFYEYKSYAEIGKLYLTHDTGVAGKYAVYQSGDHFQDNVVIGHLHRMGYVVTGNAKGKPHIATSFGWLGDVNKVDYKHRVRAHREWAHGFGLGYLMPNGNVHIYPIPIIENTVVINDIVISI